MTSSATHRAAVLALLVSGALWGTTWMPLKHFAAAGLTGLTLTLCTYGLLGVLALPWLLKARPRGWGSRRLLLLMGVLSGLSNACWVTGLMFGQVTRVMLLFYLIPVWAMLGARLFLGEPVTRLRLLAVVMAVGGAVLVLGGPGALAGPPQPLDLLAVLAGLLFAASNLCARAASEVPVPVKAVVVFAGCALVGGALIPVVDHALPPIEPPLALELAAFALVWITAAMFTQAYGITHLEAGRAGVLLVFELVAAVATAMVFAGERLDSAGWFGAALIVTAALLETLHTSHVPEQGSPP
ncbi:MAG: DMT family transporter [Betaproteobacteria bacterium]